VGVLVSIDYSKLPPECDALCQWRDCLHKGEDKGTYQPGRGYTSYYKKPEYVCMTRLTQGCPWVNNHRTLPDTKKMMSQLRDMIDSSKASRKVKANMLELVKIITLLLNIIESESEYSKAKED
jgi:hypothetical protein